MTTSTKQQARISALVPSEHDPRRHTCRYRVGDGVLVERCLWDPDCWLDGTHHIPERCLLLEPWF